jgi:hypothetical protein
MEILEDWIAMDIGDEYHIEFTNAIQVNFIDFHDELEFLEKKIIDQKVHIQSNLINGVDLSGEHKDRRSLGVHVAVLERSYIG